MPGKNLAKALGGEVTPFRPQDARRREGQANAIKEYARAVKDWAMLDKAVNQQISDQRSLVSWWRKNVSMRHGAGRAKKNADLRSLISLEQAEKLTKFSQQTISKFGTRLQDLPAYKELLRGPSYRRAMMERGSGYYKASGTGEFEWYTPAEYVERVRQVLGSVDLDPATCAAAQKIVKAKRFFTKKEDGLKQEWPGRVWLNPPYAQPGIAHYVSKLCREYVAGRTAEAVLLTHNHTDTVWFHEIAKHAAAICFTRGRVKFYRGKTIAAPTIGQAFSYFGDHVDKFAIAFADIGFIVEPMKIAQRLVADRPPNARRRRGGDPLRRIEIARRRRREKHKTNGSA